MDSEQSFYKIWSVEKQAFVGAGLMSSKHGKTWSTLGHAKAAISNRTSNPNKYKIIVYKAKPIKSEG